MTRLPILTPADLDDQQRVLYNAIAGGPRAAGPRLFALTDAAGRLNGPFNAMLFAPEVGTALQELGTAIRYRSSLTARIREMAILAVAAHWDGHIADPLFQRAVSLIGNQAVVELTSLVGYYATLALQLRVFRVGLPGQLPGESA
jgi:4-carboxymuconolactone decarboxylase